jgi:hypothetical protein
MPVVLMLVAMSVLVRSINLVLIHNLINKCIAIAAALVANTYRASEHSVCSECFYTRQYIQQH